MFEANVRNLGTGTPGEIEAVGKWRIVAEGQHRPLGLPVAVNYRECVHRTAAGAQRHMTKDTAVYPSRLRLSCDARSPVSG